MDTTNYKTLWMMLQECVTKQDKFFSLHEFLLDSTEEDRREVHDMLVDMDSIQYENFMDSFTFVSKDEVSMATVEYYEFVNQTTASMWEIMDLANLTDDYCYNHELFLDD